MLSCNEVGRVKNHQAMIDFVEEWLEEVDTDPMVVTCVVEYARGRGYITMQDICRRMGSQYQVMAEDQDTIGLRRFMEGMLSWHLVGLQANHYALIGEGLQLLTLGKSASDKATGGDSWSMYLLQYSGP
jgi:hypothetical protein